MGRDEMKMEMIQCLTTFGYNEALDDLEAMDLDGSDQDGISNILDEL